MIAKPTYKVKTTSHQSLLGGKNELESISPKQRDVFLCGQGLNGDETEARLPPNWIPNEWYGISHDTMGSGHVLQNGYEVEEDGSWLFNTIYFQLKRTQIINLHYQ